MEIVDILNLDIVINTLVMNHVIVIEIMQLSIEQSFIILKQHILETLKYQSRITTLYYVKKEYPPVYTYTCSNTTLISKLNAEDTFISTVLLNLHKELN